MNKVAIGALVYAALSGCVSNQAVRTVQPGDDEKSCQTLRAELIDLGVKFEDAKDDSGLTGKNVGLAIVFWPGIIVNEVRANKNQDSLDARIAHLSGIYNQKCQSDKPAAESNAGSTQDQKLSERLSELKDLLDKGLITQEEYETGRQKALKELF